MQMVLISRKMNSCPTFQDFLFKNDSFTFILRACVDVCADVSTPVSCLVSKKPEKVIVSLGGGGKDNCEPPYGRWELIPGPLQVQQCF